MRLVGGEAAGEGGRLGRGPAVGSQPGDQQRVLAPFDTPGEEQLPAVGGEGDGELHRSGRGHDPGGERRGGRSRRSLAQVRAAEPGGGTWRQRDGGGGLPGGIQLLPPDPADAILAVPIARVQFHRSAVILLRFVQIVTEIVCFGQAVPGVPGLGEGRGVEFEDDQRLGGPAALQVAVAEGVHLGFVQEVAVVAGDAGAVLGQRRLQPAGTDQRFQGPGGGLGLQAPRHVDVGGVEILALPAPDEAGQGGVP